MLNPKFIVMNAELGERYAAAKTNISWAQPALGRKVDLSELRHRMDALHRAWPGRSIYADANFPALLDEFEAEWGRVFLPHMTPIYGFPAALELFSAAGAPLSRQAFHASILPHLVKSGFARKLGGNGHGGTWEFDRRYLQHWAEYVAEVQKRKANGGLPGNYGYSEDDMQALVDGAWD